MITMAAARDGPRIGRGPVRGKMTCEEGWINYHGGFYHSELTSLAKRIDEHLVRWAMQKFKRLRNRPQKAWAWLRHVKRRAPKLFAHWHVIARTDGRSVGARSNPER
jgi:hypothetical protein